MTKKKIVSVDFDGVVIEKAFYRDWANQIKPQGGKKNSLMWFYGLDWLWTNINQMWRRPIKGSKEGLAALKVAGYEIAMMTSRKIYIKETTIRWLKKWRIFPYYNEFFFNSKYVGGVDSKIANIKKLEPYAHIDDNAGTALMLAESFPKMKIYWLCKDKMPKLPGNIIPCRDWEEIVKKLKAI